MTGRELMDGLAEAEAEAEAEEADADGLVSRASREELVA